MTTLRIATEGGATSEYTGADFNSICRAEDGNTYLLTEAGLFRLGGDDDAGAPIAASIDLGKQDFGSPALKRTPAAYVGASSTGLLALTVEVEGAEYTYPSRAASALLQQQRFDLGRGLRANWFGLTLSNTAGGDFEIADFSIDVAESARRI